MQKNLSIIEPRYSFKFCQSLGIPRERWIGESPGKEVGFHHSFRKKVFDPKFNCFLRIYFFKILKC